MPQLPPVLPLDSGLHRPHCHVPRRTLPHAPRVPGRAGGSRLRLPWRQGLCHPPQRAPVAQMMWAWPRQQRRLGTLRRTLRPVQGPTLAQALARSRAPSPSTLRIRGACRLRRPPQRLAGLALGLGLLQGFRQVAGCLSAAARACAASPPPARRGHCDLHEQLVAECKAWGKTWMHGQALTLAAAPQQAVVSRTPRHLQPHRRLCVDPAKCRQRVAGHRGD